MSPIQEQRHMLYPLDVFYVLEDQPIPDAEFVEAGQMPEIAQQLLNHTHDMTGTLEQHYGAPMRLEVLNSHRRRTTFLRKVLLTPRDSDKPAEFGAIAIHLDKFDPALQEEILGCHKPLGAILRDYHVDFVSHLGGFVQIFDGQRIRKALKTRSVKPLYGRKNVLQTQGGAVLAEVLELLPPGR